MSGSPADLTLPQPATPALPGWMAQRRARRAAAQGTRVDPYAPTGIWRLIEGAGAVLLAVLWIAPLVFAVWAAFHAPEYTTLAPDMLGRAVYVQRLQGTRFEVAIESVVDVQDVGDREVIPLDFGGRSFPAGESRDALIFSHNMQKTDNSWMASDVALRMVAGIESIAATNAAMAQTDQTRAMDELAGSTRTGR